MSHTRGPWTIIPKDYSYPDVTISGPAPDPVTKARFMPIATVHTYKNMTYPCFYEVTEEERDANAQLIAAAPELYDLFKRQDKIINSILTDSQLDTKVECGKTLREYVESVRCIMRKVEAQ